jgi:hypothetical protein
MSHPLFSLSAFMPQYDGVRHSHFALAQKNCQADASNVGRTRVNLALLHRLLQAWLLTRLGRVFGAGCDFFAVLFLFLLHFFVVRDIAGVGH